MKVGDFDPHTSFLSKKKNIKMTHVIYFKVYVLGKGKVF